MSRTKLVFWIAFLVCLALAAGAFSILLVSQKHGQAFGLSDFLLGTVSTVFAGFSLKYLRAALMEE